MKTFGGSSGLLLIIVVILLASIGIQIWILQHLLLLLKESEELEEGNASKIRFWIEEYIENEKEIMNIPIFVEQKIHQFKIRKYTLTQMKHISGQLLLFAIFLAGLGVCKDIIGGKTLGQILPFYVICLLGLYIHFLLSGFLDMEEKNKTIQRNVVNFLENKKAYLYQKKELQTQLDIEDRKDIFGEKEDEELKNILREILA